MILDLVQQPLQSWRLVCRLYRMKEADPACVTELDYISFQQELSFLHSSYAASWASPRPGASPGPGPGSGSGGRPWSEALILRRRGQLPEPWSRRFVRVHAVHRIIWNRWKNANTNSKNLQLSPENLKTSGTPLTQSVYRNMASKWGTDFWNRISSVIWRSFGLTTRHPYSANIIDYRIGWIFISSSIHLVWS